MVIGPPLPGLAAAITLALLAQGVRAAARRGGTERRHSRVGGNLAPSGAALTRIAEARGRGGADAACAPP